MLINTVTPGDLWYKPSSYTVGYRPFKSDIKDYSGNWYDFSIKSWSVSFSNNMVTVTERLQTWSNTAVMTNYAGDFTELWYTQSSGSTNNWFMFLFNPSDNWTSAFFWINTNWCAWSYIYWNNQWWTWVDYSTVPTWVHLLAFVKTSSAKILYLDWVEVARDTSNVNAVGSVSGMTVMWLWRHSNWWGTARRGNLILEKRAWTQDEIQKYFSQTKSNYWL